MRQGFKQEEAEQILTEAVRRASEERTTLFEPTTTSESEIPRERLQAMAEELGIPLATLEAVLRDREVIIAREGEQLTLAQERHLFVQERRAGFYPHFWAYSGVIGVLVAIYFLTTPGGYFWPVWPALGWGLGLFLHAMARVPTTGPNFTMDFEKWRERRRRSSEKRNAKELRRAADGATAPDR